LQTSALPWIYRGGRGWLAIVAVIAGNYAPVRVDASLCWCSLCLTLFTRKALCRHSPSVFFLMLPHVVRWRCFKISFAPDLGNPQTGVSPLRHLDKCASRHATSVLGRMRHN
jgi:hypothetical protein